MNVHINGFDKPISTPNERLPNALVDCPVSACNCMLSDEWYGALEEAVFTLTSAC